MTKIELKEIKEYKKTVEAGGDDSDFTAFGDKTFLDLTENQRNWMKNQSVVMLYRAQFNKAIGHTSWINENHLKEMISYYTAKDCDAKPENKEGGKAFTHGMATPQLGYNST